ncbi:MAG TPA: GNAT family N-acetyltransferase [Caulobacteraceae bacterium]
MLRLGEFRPAVLQVAPTVSAALTLACGAMLLVSGATPSDPERFAWLMSWAPVLLVELSHFLSSVLGLALVLTAFGLNRRLDAAWGATLTLGFAAAVLAFFKGVDWEETVILLGLCGVLLPLREAFPRSARLSQIEIAPGWLISAFLLLVGAGVLGWWLFHNVDYGDQQPWRVMRDDPSRAIRATIGAGTVLLVIGLWRLFATPATPRIVGDHDPDFDQVRAILASCEGASPDAGLALLGDKRFLFSQSGRSFLMFGVRSRSWIAMGAPVGVLEDRHELLWRFRELADAHAARPGFYGLGPELLPEMVEMGFAIQKAGEAAVVPLETFSLQGRKREVLRRNWRKAGEAGAGFEVIEAAEVAAHMDDLKRISDQWLARHSGGEKGFSMGGFVERYVAEFPCALVRREGRIVAFASLWTTPDKSEFSMDLMRYCDAAPKNVMDFLFVELLQWGRTAGYRAFDFGMAPLAGMLDRPLTPLLSRIGRLLFERGEEIYNFQGVRRYKDKFDPSWAPRYIAGPSKWSIPILLADVGLLSSGGVSGLTRRTPAAPVADDPPPLPQAA